jgi:hypothetical protein
MSGGAYETLGMRKVNLYLHTRIIYIYVCVCVFILEKEKKRFASSLANWVHILTLSCMSQVCSLFKLYWWNMIDELIVGFRGAIMVFWSLENIIECSITGSVFNRTGLENKFQIITSKKTFSELYISSKNRFRTYS